MENCTIPDYYGPNFRTFKIIIDIYIVGILCALGLVGNLLSVFVLRRIRHGTTPLLLQGLAVTDCCFLLTCLVFQTLRVCYAYYPHLHLQYLPYVEKWVWPLAAIAQTCTVYFVVLVTADRWWAICYPLKSKSMATRRRASVAMVIVILWSVAFNIPVFFDMDVRWVNESCRYEARASDFHNQPLYQSVYKSGFCFAFRTVLPLVIVLILNVKLIQAIKASKHDIRVLSNNRRQDGSSSSLNVVIVAVVVIFIICALPDLVYRCLHTIEMYSRDTLALTWIHFAYLGTVSNLLLTANSSVNFIIYCLTGGKFRQQLRTLCFGRAKLSETAGLYSRTAITRLTPSPCIQRRDLLVAAAKTPSPCTHKRDLLVAARKR